MTYPKPRAPSRPHKTPIAFWVDGYYHCPDCAPEASLLALETLPCYDEREIPGSLGCKSGCGRFHLQAPEFTVGKGECRACGCFGEDLCTDPVRQAALAAEKKKPLRGRKKKVAEASGEE